MVYVYILVAVIYMDSFFQETAHDKNQKYKEGKSVLERWVNNQKYGEKLWIWLEWMFLIEIFWIMLLIRFKVSGPDGSHYWVSHGAHVGGSDADDVWLTMNSSPFQLYIR